MSSGDLLIWIPSLNNNYYVIFDFFFLKFNIQTLVFQQIIKWEWDTKGVNHIYCKVDKTCDKLDSLLSNLIYAIYELVNKQYETELKLIDQST